MDEPQKTSFFPVPVRWFEVPMDGMKRGFTHLKQKIDQIVQLDQIRSRPNETVTKEEGRVASPETETPRRSDPSVGVHLNTYA